MSSSNPTFVNDMNLFGNHIKQIPCIVGEGSPTESTAGAVGMLYMDSSNNGEMYKCVKVSDDKYTWEKLISENSGENVAQVEPAEDDIPKIYIKGTLPTSKADEDVKVRIRYKSKTMDFEYPSTLKVQGHSSTVYPKKNFTWKLYADDTYESKVKVAFRNWGKMNKFVLKAHWVDASHIRNVGAAKIFGAMVRSRPDFDTLPEELRNAPNNGATDGFTVKVFANGIYQGLYELIVPKDKLFGQDSDITTHSILNSELNNELTCAFATTEPSINGKWSEELQDDMSGDIATSFANLIKFVAGSTDAEFAANAENYFDVLSVIDFDIFARIIAPVDNLCKNQIFFTYDGVKWYEGGWDFDGVFGLTPSCTWTPSDTPFQEGYVAYKNHGITNMLYKRVEENFLDRFKERYWALRAGVFSESNLIDVLDRLADTIAHYAGLLAEDYAETTGGGAFTGIPLKASNNIQQIRNWLAERVVYMDEVVANMVPPVPCTGITLDSSTLSFDALGVTQALAATVTPADTTDTVVWSSDNESVATVTQDGIVKSIALGNATITATCGAYSASCAVTVEFVVVPCTEVVLSQTELTFDGEGSQTLTATVTPDDTTDALIWESADPTIATVTDGVVTAVWNGTTTITATCGEQTATCGVTVSGFKEPGIFDGIVWLTGGIRTDGTLTTSADDVHTDKFSVAKLTHIYATYTATNSPLTANRIVFYDSADTFVSYANPTGSTSAGVYDLDIPDGAAYAAFAAFVKSDGGAGFSGLTIRETADGEIIGELPYPNPTE